MRRHHPDGILAESIAPGDPARTGLWLMAGTSQACAIASGLAVPWVARGFTPDEYRARMQDVGTADERRGHGWGEGMLKYAEPSEDALPPENWFYVSMLSSLVLHNGYAHQQTRITVRHEDSRPARRARVFATIRDDATRMVECVTDRSGVCVLWDERPVPPEEAAWRTWTTTVEVVSGEDYALPTRSAMTTTRRFDRAVRALRVAEQSDAILAWRFPGGTHPVLGTTLPSLSVTDTGAGVTSVPTSLVMGWELARSLGSVKEIPLGRGRRGPSAEILDFDGSGLASIPLGLQQFKLVMMRPHMQGPFGALPGLSRGPDVLDAHGDGAFVPLDGGVAPGFLQGTGVGDQLTEDLGWRASGYAGASALMATTWTDAPPSESLEFVGEATGAMPFDPPR